MCSRNTDGELILYLSCSSYRHSSFGIMNEATAQMRASFSRGVLCLTTLAVLYEEESSYPPWASPQDARNRQNSSGW